MHVEGYGRTPSVWAARDGKSHIAEIGWPAWRLGRMLDGVHEIPPRTATDAYLARIALFGRPIRLDVVFDVDLGELVEGHHVVARGLELADADAGAVLHYEFVPGLKERETERKGHFFWYWMLSAHDDAGTDYSDDNGGAFEPEGETASHGTRDLGGVVPAWAKRLRLDFTPAEGWTPIRPWCRRLDVDLADRNVTTHIATHKS